MGDAKDGPTSELPPAVTLSQRDIGSVTHCVTNGCHVILRQVSNCHHEPLVTSVLSSPSGYQQRFWRASREGCIMTATQFQHWPHHGLNCHSGNDAPEKKNIVGVNKTLTVTVILNQSTHTCKLNYSKDFRLERTSNPMRNMIKMRKRWALEDTFSPVADGAAADFRRGIQF